jgi:hypothetical protein
MEKAFEPWWITSLAKSSSLFFPRQISLWAMRYHRLRSMADTK